MTKQEREYVPATLGKNVLLAIVAVACVYLNIKNLSSGMTFDSILVLSLTAMSMYAIMTFKSNR